MYEAVSDFLYSFSLENFMIYIWWRNLGGKQALVRYLYWNDGMQTSHYHPVSKQQASSGEGAYVYSWMHFRLEINK